MRIVYVITRADEVGGAQVHVRDLATAVSGAGHEVTVLSGTPGVLAEQLADQGVPLRVVPDLVRPIAPPRDLAALRQLRALLEELRPDLVTVHSSKAGWLGRVAARRRRLPVIFPPMAGRSPKACRGPRGPCTGWPNGSPRRSPPTSSR